MHWLLLVLLWHRQGYKDIGDVSGSQAYREMAGPDGLAEELRGMLEFQPYTVTTATGGQFGMTARSNYGSDDVPDADVSRGASSTTTVVVSGATNVRTSGSACS